MQVLLLSIALYSACTSIQSLKLHSPGRQCDLKLSTGFQNFTHRILTLPWLILIKMIFRKRDQETHFDASIFFLNANCGGTH